MKCMRPGKCSGTGLRPEVAIDTGVLIGKYRSHAMIIVLLGNDSRRKVMMNIWSPRVTELFDVCG